MREAWRVNLPPASHHGPSPQHESVMTHIFQTRVYKACRVWWIIGLLEAWHDAFSRDEGDNLMYLFVTAIGVHPITQ